jgi:flagellar protein FliL
MADIPTLEPAQDVALADDAEAPARRRSPWLLITIIAVVVLGGGAGAAFWLMQGHATPKPAKAMAAPLGPALYLALDPPFVTNFETEQLVRFLQITVQIMSRDPATVELLKANDPALRNDLLLLFSNQKYAEISTREGKEHLRAQALTTVRHIVQTSGGKPERVEAVYFTSFVMQ